MATVAKDFKIKNGLIVEGSTGTINNYDILTKSSSDQNYIVGLIGGTATSNNTANAVVKRDGSGDFAAGMITADLTGDVTGTVSDISNHDTGDLSEGTNLYFTNARAQDALAGMYDPAGSAANALADAENYADGVAQDAYNNATSYADGLAGNYDAAGAAANALTSAQSYADSAAANAQSAAESYADSLAGNYDPAGSASSAQTAAQNYADSAAANALSNANSYTDTAVANLVDSAPALLDTLNELAAAIGDDANFVTTVTNLVATKQNTLTAGSNIDITGNTISVTGVDLAGAADTAYNNAVSYADSLAGNYDPAGSAANALTSAQSYADSAAANAYSNATSYADGLAANYDAAGSADTAYNNAVAYADALTTSDIAEGTNEYFTNARAKAAAADLLTGATLTNITITGSGAGLTISAENGVADSDTDDLTEGTSNLYFTNARAIAALEAVTPDFPSIEIATVAKQVAAEASVPTASTNTAVSWAKADYRSAEFLVKIANGSHTEVSKVILTLDTSDNVAITEYAMVGTNGSLGSVSADVSGSDVRVRVTTDNNNSTVAVIGTLLK
jgi:hypothetical protein